MLKMKADCDNNILKIDKFDSFKDIVDKIHKFREDNNFDYSLPKYIEIEFEILKYVIIKEWQEGKSLYEGHNLKLIELGCSPFRIKPFPESEPVIDKDKLKGATIYGIPIKLKNEVKNEKYLS